MRRRTLVYTGIALTVALLIGAAGLARWGSRPALAEAREGAAALKPDSAQSDSAGTAMESDAPAGGGVVAARFVEPPFGELPLVMKGEFPDARVDIALIAPPDPVFLDAVRGLPPTRPSVHGGGAFLPLALGLPVLLVDHNDHEHDKPPSPPPPGVVPEPAPLLLLGTGMVLLFGVYGWRRRLA